MDWFLQELPRCLQPWAVYERADYDQTKHLHGRRIDSDGIVIKIIRRKAHKPLAYHAACLSGDATK